MSEKFLKQPGSTGSEDDVEAKAITETNVQVEPQHGGAHIVDEHEENDLSRSLSQRHIQMIALAGAIVRYPCLRVSGKLIMLGNRVISQSWRSLAGWRTSWSSARIPTRRTRCLRRTIRSWRSISTLSCHWILRPTCRTPGRPRARLRYWMERGIRDISEYTK